MRPSLRGGRTGTLALVAASAALPGAVIHRLSSEGTAPFGPWAHLGAVTAAAVVAAVASFGLVALGARRGEPRAVLVGGAFAAMATLLVVHGLATPTALVGMNGLVALSGGAALPVGGALLALTTVPALHRPDRVRAVLAGEAVVVALVVGAGVAALMAPERVPALPQAGSPLAWAVLVTGAVFFAAIAHRAARTFRLTRRRADLAVVVGAVWLGVALLPTLLIAPQTWAWWTGHVLELLGVALVGVPVALDLRRAAPSRPLVGDLRAAELVQAEEAFLGSRVRALVGRLGAHDPSTEQHTRRVALLAVTVGERLGLPPGRLRELAVGALLHDMGKLAVPAAVLNKPGALDDGERALVNEHPGRGDDLLRELGFGAGVRRLVRDHHERLDGGGYPGRRPAAELDLPTRILTVCDVFDALTSHRVYRPAPFTPDAALDLLRGETGTAFDGRCVAALADVAGAGVAAPAALAAAA